MRADQPSPQDMPGGGNAPNGVSRMDAYLDGLLLGDDRRRMEQEVEGDAKLGATRALQSRIDASLRAQFACPKPFALRMDLGSDVASHQGDAPLSFEKAAQRRGWWRTLPGRLTALAAVLLLGTAVLWSAGVNVPGMLGYTPSGYSSPTGVYIAKVRSGFKPTTVCHDSEEFQNYTENAFNQPFTIEEGEGITVVGWCYGDPILSDKTETILAEADHQKVMLIVDQKDQDRDLAAPLWSGLHVHRAEVGRLVVYEVGQSVSPRVLPLIHKAKCNSVMTDSK